MNSCELAVPKVVGKRLDCTARELKMTVAVNLVVGLRHLADFEQSSSL